jgi:hypothetical protein
MAIVGLVLLCGSCLIGLLLPAVSFLSEAARRCQCRDSLKQIGLGLHNYLETYGRLPPVHDGDGAGQPPCSWRVRLLPFLEQDHLFQQNNFREPWDGPNNLKLASQSCYIYRCLSDRDSRPQGTTSYLAVVGPDGNWLEPDNREGDTSNPVRVVETCELRIVWTEPRDVLLEEIHSPSSSQPAALSSHHFDEGSFFYYDQPIGAHALFADGRVYMIPPDVPGDVLRVALLGDRNKQDELATYYGGRQLNWSNCAALASLIICFLLMLAWPRRQAM